MNNVAHIECLHYTILAMHLLDLVNILPSLDHIKVELVPASGCGNFRTRETSKRGEAETIKPGDTSIDGEEPNKSDREIDRSTRR